ncbi:MAG TPA: GldM family protein [Saprospiraceae bacterium]|nr:GldM family protein [Saprospiraceae bacterium]
MKYLLPLALLLLLSACMTLSNDTGFTSAETPVPVELVGPYISVDKMNVFYIGVENPISVSVPRVRSDSVSISIENGSFTKDGHGRYLVKVNNPGQVKVTVSASDGAYKANQTFHFRAKRIPDPVPTLDYPPKYNYTAGEFRVKLGMFMVLQDFDFDARCQMASFVLTRIPQNGERQTALNKGERFGEAAKALVDQAESGDAFIFSEIKTLCPGDTTARQLNSVVYFIQ